MPSLSESMCIFVFQVNAHLDQWGMQDHKGNISESTHCVVCWSVLFRPCLRSGPDYLWRFARCVIAATWRADYKHVRIPNVFCPCLRGQFFTLRSIYLVPTLIFPNALRKPVYPTDVGRNPNKTSDADISLSSASWSDLHLNSLGKKHSSPLEVLQT